MEYFYIKRQQTIRKFLSKFTFGLSTGYGSTTYKHKLDGFGILQNPDSIPKIYVIGSPTTGYYNWVNKATASGNFIDPSSVQVEDDGLGFKAKGFNIPIKATVHVEFNRYRIGGGYSYEYAHVGTFKPVSYGDQISSFTPEVSTYFLKKYFGMIGGAVYRYENYLLVIDANIGGYSLGKKFDKSQIKKGVFINIGATVERELSEYFKLFVRPSYEIKSYKLNLPESGQSITHKFNALYINIGATYRIPEMRRCYDKQCRIQRNHAHGNREYRSRVHPIWKKQNPNYGENHPVLIKYKGKNKKKLNPY
ncbi:MAG: hypothetical protein L0Y35_07275 [Flammeovirgaceae bacterium]|nr:hypothetical protein [Flammeovirgaceae bacterium]